MKTVKLLLVYDLGMNIENDEEEFKLRKMIMNNWMEGFYDIEYYRFLSKITDIGILIDEKG